MKEHDRKVLFSKKSDEHPTPQELFDELNEEFHFTLDPCATPENAKCSKFYTIEDDGLEKEWNDEVVFVNPPYSNCKGWVKKAVFETKTAPFLRKGAKRVVMLLPSRTDTKWFHEDLLPNVAEIRFIKGRLKFEGNSNSAPFPSIVVVFEQVRSSLMNTYMSGPRFRSMERPSGKKDKKVQETTKASRKGFEKKDRLI